MTDKLAKYQQIVGLLRQDIATGRYATGDRLPSEHALAIRHDVSRPTAGRALKELALAGLVDRRAGAGSYVRAPATPQATHTYGLLAQGLGGTEILDPICTEITRACQREGATVLWGPGPTDPDHDQVAELAAVCDYYIERRVDGVFFAPLEHVPDREAANLRIAATLQEAGIAVVLLDRDVTDFPGRSSLDIVGIDNFKAGFDLGTHLANDGYRSYVFLARPHFPATTDLRAAGVREALHRHHRNVPDDWLRPGEPTDEVFVAALVHDAQPDAIICSNDRTAALLVRTLSDLHVAVPGDLGIAGFDDVRYSTLLPVSLTTMHQPCEAIARAAIRTMHQRCADPTAEPQQVMLDANLIARRSCSHPDPADEYAAPSVAPRGQPRGRGPDSVDRHTVSV